MSSNLAHHNPIQAGAQANRPSEAELLRRFARERDETAFADLVQCHVDLVFSAALRQLAGDHQRAQDVTQLVFAELARKAARLENHPTLSGWLYTTTRFVARGVLRAEERRIRRERMAHAMQDALDRSNPNDPGPSWSQIAKVLDEAMHELSENDRAAVVLRHFEDRPFAEVGHRLGLSPNAARMRVDRALEKLRERLARRGITSSSAALAAVLAGNAVQASPLGLSALVAGAATTTALATVPLFNLPTLAAIMSLKSKLIITGIVASMIVTPLAFQQRTIGQLRRDLAGAQADLRDLTRTEADARRAAELTAAENASLKASQIELLRLRGEMGPLKDQLRALSRSASTAPVAPKPSAAPKPEAGNRDGGGLADLGSTTAEHAATSLIWAVSKGRIDRLSELLELPPTVTPDDAPRHYAFFAKQLVELFGGKDFNGWKLDLKGTTNDDRVRLDFGYRDLVSGKDEAFGFQLRRHQDGWKVMVEGDVPESF